MACRGAPATWRDAAVVFVDVEKHRLSIVKKVVYFSEIEVKLIRAPESTLTIETRTREQELPLSGPALAVAPPEEV